jgi:hypothetical protein
MPWLGDRKVTFQHLVLAAVLLLFAGLCGEWTHLLSHGHWVDHQHDLASTAAGATAESSLGHHHGDQSAPGSFLRQSDGPSGLPLAVSKALIQEAGAVERTATAPAPFVPPRCLHSPRAPPRLA